MYKAFEQKFNVNDKPMSALGGRKKSKEILKIENSMRSHRKMIFDVQMKEKIASLRNLNKGV